MLLLGDIALVIWDLMIDPISHGRFFYTFEAKAFLTGPGSQPPFQTPFVIATFLAAPVKNPSTYQPLQSNYTAAVDAVGTE